MNKKVGISKMYVGLVDYVRKDVGLQFLSDDSEAGAYIAEEPHKSQT